MVRVEHRVRQISTAAAQCGGDEQRDAVLKRFKARQCLAFCSKDLPEQRNVGARGGFVQRNAQGIVCMNSQVNARTYCGTSY